MRRCTSGRPDRFMLISSERVFYAGLHGKPSVRTLGALAVCVPLHGTACLEVAGQPPALVAVDDDAEQPGEGAREEGVELVGGEEPGGGHARNL